MKKLPILLFLLAALGCTIGNSRQETAPETDSVADVYDRHGTTVRHDTARKVIYLVFSADSMFEGAPTMLEAMDNRGIKGNFFFTGNFLEREENHDIIRRIIDGHHYVSGHSNRHLLLADWDNGHTPLVTIDSMLSDVDSNFMALERYGIERDSARWFLPPYEWIAGIQTKALRDSMGLEVINPTPGIQIFRDYTTPDMADYHSSDSILRQLFEFERNRGLNGAFLIIHLGTQDVRTDKLYNHAPMLLDSLLLLGYTFERL